MRRKITIRGEDVKPRKHIVLRPSDFRDKGLQPGIIWGEHGTSELLPISIKDVLQADQDLADIPFIEYGSEFRRWNDYIELLFRKQEWGPRFERKAKEMKARIKEYETALRAEYGPLMFNLHEGPRFYGFEGDIHFRIPNHIQQDGEVGTYSKHVAEKHGLDLRVILHEREPGPNKVVLISPESVIVEFILPEPRSLKRYPSPEVESLSMRTPDTAGYERLKHMVADTSHPLYQQTVAKYAAFMKDVLLGLKEMEIR